jgi:hypothetical protein
MVFNGIVLGPRSHAFWFKAAKGESANVIFVDCGVEISIFRNWKANCIAKLLDLVKKRE